MAARQTGSAVSGNRRTANNKNNSKTNTSASMKKTASGKKPTSKTSAGKRTQTKSAGGGSRTRNSKKTGRDVDYRRQSGMYDEVQMLIALGISVLLLLSIYDLCGVVGDYVSKFVFGVFGWFAYLLPYLIFFGSAFYISNRHNRIAFMRIAASVLVAISIMAFLQMLFNPGDSTMTILDYYDDSSVYRSGGGIIGGILCSFLNPLIGTVATYALIIILFFVGLALMAEKAVIADVWRKIRTMAASAAQRHRQKRALLDAAREEARLEALDREDAKTDTDSNKIISISRRTKITDDIEDEDDYDDLDEDDLFLLKKKNKKKKKAVREPSEFGETIQPLGFDYNIAQLDQEKAQMLRYNGDHAQDDQEVPAPVLKDEDDLKKEIILDIPQFTVTHMGDIDRAGNCQENSGEPSLTQNRENERQDIRKEQAGQEMQIGRELESDMENFEFQPDPVYFEPMNVPEDKDQFGQTAKLPDLSHLLDRAQKDDENFRADNVQEMPLPQNDEIRERSVEEKYTNLPEYEPKTEAISPAEAVRRAARASDAGPDHRHGGEKAACAPEPVTAEEIVPPVKEYVFPPLELLKQGKPSKVSAEGDQQLRETAMKLQSTLDSFGVKVQVTNVSCGPSVTRYELQPEQGVKVSKIVALTDDIKLNLAVADIRIEAPIPGKAAVGIEVPNKENTTVMLRDLLESQEFQNSKSLIAFGAGRDIGGQVIVADIAKMPHLLIAGATGSGKSVCINTLIMSIIYKARPEDVRMIMIDPKVVELSVYNGIPHLLIPVVTDPKKAAGALNWAVAEMETRYKKFAQLNVRDMKSYNAKIEACEYESQEHQKLPQIVIIVDELADLMMVASNEVEDAICRLAQLARAAGIHLVIATQRPSVNVITGLIKANIPSRIAFSVSSGVDSRTIIDMNGAEKLLGKGDMLFYPTGYQKPVRVQGAFVSDQEVNAVVEFLTKDQDKPQYNEEIANSINSPKAVQGGSAPERDVYFVEAGKFIIEKEKASIGMLQRVYKIGFNRAARIMDQLCDAGVVGPEEGTKPRKVLMSAEEFERYIEEYV